MSSVGRDSFGVIKEQIGAFERRLKNLGFDDQERATILYEVVLIASAKLSENDLSFLSPDELKFVSNSDLLQLTPDILAMATSSRPNLSRYLDIYVHCMEAAIAEFNHIVVAVTKEESERDESRHISSMFPKLDVDLSSNSRRGPKSGLKRPHWFETALLWLLNLGTRSAERNNRSK